MIAYLVWVVDFYFHVAFGLYIILRLDPLHITYSLGFELLFKLRSAAYECLAPGYQVFL